MTAKVKEMVKEIVKVRVKEKVRYATHTKQVKNRQVNLIHGIS